MENETKDEKKIEEKPIEIKTPKPEPELPPVLNEADEKLHTEIDVVDWLHSDNWITNGGVLDSALSFLDSLMMPVRLEGGDKHGKK